MWTQDRLLDAARDSLGDDATDYQLSRALGITTAYMSQLRHGARIMSQKLALQIATMARAPFDQVLAALQMQRAQQNGSDPAIAATWQRIARRLGGKAAGIAGLLATAAIGISAPAPSQAATGGPASSPALYIMANRRRSDWQPAPA